MGMIRELSADELAHESEATPVLINDLVRIGAHKQGPTGGFSSRDVARVRIAESHLRAGLTLDELERALAEQLFSFDYIDRFYMEPVARSARTSPSSSVSSSRVAGHRREAQTLRQLPLSTSRASRP